MSKIELLPGIHTVTALLRMRPERAHNLWVEQNKKNNRIDQVIQHARRLGIPIQAVDRKKLDHLCEGTQHQGIAASCSATALLDEHDLFERCRDQNSPPLILVLDEIGDPHNLGACLRTADAAGVDAVVVPTRHTPALTPTVHKVASGATIGLNIVRTPNLARFLEALKQEGVWILGADGDSEHPIYDANLTNSTAIIMGAEGQGLRRLTRERCDLLYSLPMQGMVESLNVSVATGVFLYEAVRQRSRVTGN